MNHLVWIYCVNSAFFAFALYKTTRLWNAQISIIIKLNRPILRKDFEINFSWLMITHRINQYEIIILGDKEWWKVNFSRNQKPVSEKLVIASYCTHWNISSEWSLLEHIENSLNLTESQFPHKVDGVLCKVFKEFVPNHINS